MLEPQVGGDEEQAAVLLLAAVAYVRRQCKSRGVAGGDTTGNEEAIRRSRQPDKANRKG